MNCTKCGANLPEGSIFCPSCGANVNEQPADIQSVTVQPVYQQPMMQQPAMQQPAMQQPVMQQPVMQQPVMQQPVMQQPAMQQPVMQQTYNQQMAVQPMYAPAPKKSKAPWIALGVSLFLIIAIIAIVVVLLFACSKDEANKSPTAVVTSCLNAAASGDSEALIQTVYPALITQFRVYGYSNKEIFDELSESIIDDETNVKFSNIQVTDTVKLDGDETNQYNERLKDMAGYIKITAVYEVEGTLYAKTDSGSGDLEFEALVVRCDDEYYLIDISVD